jgi:hypothetical protein
VKRRFWRTIAPSLFGLRLKDRSQTKKQNSLKPKLQAILLLRQRVLPADYDKNDITRDNL